jgi:hypothetical protein
MGEFEPATEALNEAIALARGAGDPPAISTVCQTSESSRTFNSSTIVQLRSCVSA